MGSQGLLPRDKTKNGPRRKPFFVYAKGLLVCETLIKLGQDAGCLGPGGGASGSQGAVLVAVDQVVAVGPVKVSNIASMLLFAMER